MNNNIKRTYNIVSNINYCTLLINFIETTIDVEKVKL